MPLTQAQLSKLQADAQSAEQALTQLDACVFATPINPAAVTANGANVAFKLTALTNDIAGLVADPPPVTPPAPPPVTTKPAVGWFHAAPDQCPVPYSIALDYGYDTPSGTLHSNSYTQAAARAYTNAGKRLMLKVGLVIPAEATAIGTELVAGGQPNAIIPIGWEGNQDVNGWFNNWNETADTAAQFKAKFNAACAAFRAVPGADFLFVWCPNVNNAGNQAAGRTQFDTDPGPAKDVVLGPDGYDFPKGQGSVAAAIATYAAYYTYAQQAGWVFAGLCEWGCNAWDDPAYVTATLQWLVSIKAQFQVYMSEPGGGQIDSQLSSYPQSQAAYKAGA